MIVGICTLRETWDKWSQVEAYLEPARRMGGFKSIVEDDEELFAVFDGEDLIAVATAWFNADRNYVEVKLVGGRGHRRWLKYLDEYIGAAALEAGATGLLAMGRRGWTRILPALGWAVIGETDGSTVYFRSLEK